MREERHFSDYDSYLFGHSTHYDLYNKLGSHKALAGPGVYFAVWAPHALAVSVVGDFNGWNTDADPMTRVGAIGVWETVVPAAQNWDRYKYAVTCADGTRIFKADPFANYAEFRPGTASKVCDLSGIHWSDKRWMNRRQTFDIEKDPMTIYECHIGSWMRHPFRQEGVEGAYTYREFGEKVADYCLAMGYTHVELMGIAEHPYDGSWGYQVTGYFAPTSRYGTPEDFAYMVNYLHRKGIGVILDWVPAHFPKDEHGLALFDGEPLYEYKDPRKGEHEEWGTKVFDFGKAEVKNFLLASALYWIEFFHVDGLRVDAVASMLYLDYGRKEGEWVPNEYGENKNLEAVELFRHLNSLILGRNRGVVTIAEESTAWPGVTGRPEEGGLGFSLKWNMGWMNDFLEYMKLDPLFRKGDHHKLTFSTTYCFSERYILVLSHDEVVHLKCSMLSKMPGLPGDKFANLKAGYTFMLGHPGKKLLFMGQDFGQKREWDETREIDWFLLAEEEHRSLQNYVRALFKMYQKYPALYCTDYDDCGFEWMSADDSNRSIYSFVRKSPGSKGGLLFVVNFTPMSHDNFRVGVPRPGRYTLALGTGGPGAAPITGTDSALAYPPEGKEAALPGFSVRSEHMVCNGRQDSIVFSLPPYGAYIFKY